MEETDNTEVILKLEDKVTDLEQKIDELEGDLQTERDLVKKYLDALEEIAYTVKHVLK